MPHPENEPDAKKKRRRASHIRKRRKDSSTELVRVPRSTEPVGAEAAGRAPGAWSALANEPPDLPDPPLHRPAPPPAPLPTEPTDDDSLPPTWTDDQQRLRRLEETLGIIGLAILVAAMIMAMWLRMTG